MDIGREHFECVGCVCVCQCGGGGAGDDFGGEERFNGLFMGLLLEVGCLPISRQGGLEHFGPEMHLKKYSNVTILIYSFNSCCPVWKKNAHLANISFCYISAKKIIYIIIIKVPPKFT